jgi:hypothetical protein
MKSLARDVVKVHYKDAFFPNIEFDHNSRDRDEIIGRGIKKLLDDSSFLQGPRDAQVCIYFPNEYLPHEHRADRRTSDTVRSPTSSDPFTIMANLIAFLFSSPMHLRLAPGSALQWHVHV